MLDSVCVIVFLYLFSVLVCFVCDLLCGAVWYVVVCVVASCVCVLFFVSNVCDCVVCDLLRDMCFVVLVCPSNVRVRLVFGILCDVLWLAFVLRFLWFS